MRRSKLEINFDILKILIQKGPMKLTHIMYGVNVNCDVLKKYLELLIIRGLIEARLVGGEKTVYLITPEGLALSKGWKELELSFPMIESETEVQPIFRNSVSIKV